MNKPNIHALVEAILNSFSVELEMALEGNTDAKILLSAGGFIQDVIVTESIRLETPITRRDMIDYSQHDWDLAWKIAESRIAS